MKIFLLVIALAFSFGIGASTKLEHKIKKLTQPYQRAVKFLDDLDPALQINEIFATQFFDEFDLYKRKDKQKLERALRSVKKLTKKNNLQHDERDFIETSIRDLDKVQNFIVDYATLIEYQEIAATYDCINEQDDRIVYLIIHDAKRLRLSSMKKYGLYKFVKMIKKDLHSLSVLRSKNILTQDIEVKINQLEVKLITLRLDFGPSRAQ